MALIRALSGSSGGGETYYHQHWDYGTDVPYDSIDSDNIAYKTIDVGFVPRVVVFSNSNNSAVNKASCYYDADANTGISLQYIWSSRSAYVTNLPESGSGYSPLISNVSGTTITIKYAHRITTVDIDLIAFP